MYVHCVSEKDDRMHIRVSPSVKHDFQIVAKLRGLKPSSLMHSLMVNAIREERDRSPASFVTTDPPRAVVASERVATKRDAARSKKQSGKG
jgi:hypothetical protein